jgi:hypothetical protein
MLGLSYLILSYLLRDVNEVEDGALKVSESGDRLHLDGVPLLEWVVKNPRSINDLPPEVPVVHVPHKEGLGSERVRLDVDVGAGHLVHKRGLSDVGVPSDQEGASVGVEGGEAGEVLPDLLEVGKGGLLALDDGAHAAEGSALELLAAVERVTVLEKADVVAGEGINETLGSVDLAKGQLVVVAIVKDVHKVGVKGMNVVEAGEILDDSA